MDSDLHAGKQQEFAHVHSFCSLCKHVVRNKLKKKKKKQSLSTWLEPNILGCVLFLDHVCYRIKGVFFER